MTIHCSSAELRLAKYLSPILAVALTLAGCSQQSAPPPPPPPPQVTVATPLVKAVTDWDEYTGRLASVKSVEIRARVSGYLESVHFRDGAIVKKGKLLFVIDPLPYQAVLDEQQAALNQAQVRLDLTKKELTRAQRLFKSHAISEEAFDIRTKEKHEATAALRGAKALVESAKLNVQFTRVKAPITGRISRALVTEGNLVSGGTAGSTLLTTIVSLDPIHFYFTADERAVLRYLRLDKAGTRPSSQDNPNPVRLQLADEQGFPHQGHMDFVDNRIDQATGTMQARAIFKNPYHVLVPGMFAQIQLLGEGPYEALMIPDEAIGADMAQRFVFVIDENNVPQRRPVVLGRVVDGLRIIRNGLNRNDRVVIKGIQRVRPGSPVNPQPADLAETPPAGKGDSQ